MVFEYGRLSAIERAFGGRSAIAALLATGETLASEPIARAAGDEANKKAAALGFRGRERVRAMLTNPASAPVFLLDGTLTGQTVVEPARFTPGRNANAPYRYENDPGIANIGPIGGVFFDYPTGLGTATLSWRVAFDYNGPKFGVYVYGNGSQLRVWVDEKPSSWFTITNDAAPHLLVVDLGSWAERSLVLEFDSTAAPTSFGYFGGVERLVGASIQPPSVPASWRLALIGDSYGAGAGAGMRSLGYFNTLCRLAGVCASANGARDGTGWVAGVNTAINYGCAPRQADVIAMQPDVILAQGSINDAGHGGDGRIGAAIGTWVSAVQSALPTTQIVFSGVMRPATLLGDELAVNDDIRTAALLAGLPFIDPQLPSAPWFYGTGTDAVPSGDGNADVMNSASAPGHPTPLGHVYIGRRMYAGLVAALGL